MGVYFGFSWKNTSAKEQPHPPAKIKHLDQDLFEPLVLFSPGLLRLLSCSLPSKATLSVSPYQILARNQKRTLTTQPFRLIVDIE